MCFLKELYKFISEGGYLKKIERDENLELDDERNFYQKNYKMAFRDGFECGLNINKRKNTSEYAELKKEFFPDFVDCYGDKDDD